MEPLSLSVLSEWSRIECLHIEGNSDLESNIDSLQSLLFREGGYRVRLFEEPLIFSHAKMHILNGRKPYNASIADK